jgi:hypothetical protein
MSGDLPFGLVVDEEIGCTPLDHRRCRVAYRCNFDLPGGWRGAALRALLADSTADLRTHCPGSKARPRDALRIIPTRTLSQELGERWCTSTVTCDRSANFANLSR